LNTVTLYILYIERYVCGVRVYMKKRSYSIREGGEKGRGGIYRKQERIVAHARAKIVFSPQSPNRPEGIVTCSLSLTISIYLSSCSPRCDVPSLNCTHNGNALVERHTSLLSPSNVFYNMTERIASI
jgi:hypothetical protein